MTLRVWTLMSVAALLVAGNATAQTRLALEADRDTNHASLLERPAQVVLENERLMNALHRLSEASGVPLAYSPTLMSGERLRVDCDCGEVTVRQALENLLRGTSFDYREFRGEVLVFRDTSTPTLHSSRYALATHHLDPVRTRTVKSAARTQVGAITGRVTDAATGQPLRGVNVQIEGTGHGTVSDRMGQYRLEGVPAGMHILMASFIGYVARTETVTVLADEVATIDLELEVSPVRLDQLVVTATGEQRRVELGHVVGTVRADSIVREAPVTRLTDVIGSRVPGVQILANTGLTGESPRVRIRGTNSFSLSRDPLLYIDGVRVESSTGLDWAPYGFLSGRFNDLNPNDIESIEIVKGPAAATLYGTDAANGVILVRTNRGRAGRAQWNAYFEGGLLEPAASFANTDSYYSWGTNTATGATQRCLLTQIAAGACAQDSLTVFNPLTDPSTTPIGTGSRSQFGVQVSGGASQLVYWLAVDRESEVGYLRMPDVDVERIRAERGGAAIPDWQVRPNELERWSARASLSANVGDNADVRVSTSLVSAETRIPGNDVFTAGFWGSGHPDINDGWQSTTRPGEIFAMRSAEELWRNTSSVSATWRPLTWLTTRATAGTDLSSSLYDALQRPEEGPPAGRSGRRLNRRAEVAHYTVDLGSSATFDVARNVTSRTSLGVQYNRRNALTTTASATGLPPGAETVTGAASIVGGESRVESVVAGAYVEQMIGLSERVFLTAALRGDGGSSFGRNFQTALYPKAGASWLISDEPMFPELPFLESVRLRVAYGQSGVQPGSTDAMDLVTRFTAIVDDVATTGARRSRLGNPDLRPERQRELEGGLDIDLLDGRLSLEATYYNRLSTDALVSVPVAPSAGIASRWVNLASVRNWGYEALLNARLVTSPAVTWDVSMNASINHNRLEELGIDGVTSLGNALLGLHREGFPLFGRWGRPILGYEDLNGNGIIEPGEVTVGDTLEYIGPSNPPRQLTAASMLSLADGRVRLSTQFDYRGTYAVFHGAAVNHCTFQACRAVNDLDAPFDLQARDVVARQHGTGGWTGYMERTSFVRWRELAATYDVPTGIARRFGANSLSLTLSGRNLRLWSDFTGVDPESNAQTSIPQFTDGSVVNPTAPQTRYWILRANVAF